MTDATAEHLCIKCPRLALFGGGGDVEAGAVGASLCGPNYVGYQVSVLALVPQPEMFFKTFLDISSQVDSVLLLQNNRNKCLRCESCHTCSTCGNRCEGKLFRDKGGVCITCKAAERNSTCKVCGLVKGKASFNDKMLEHVLYDENRSLVC